MYPDDVLPVPRDWIVTEEPSQVLYLISTTHNYDTWQVNLDTNIQCLLEVLQHHRKEDIFSFCSSWFVYGDVPLPAYEHMQPNPRGGNYNLTKLWAEQLVQDYCGEHGIPWKIFRLANVFGKGDKFSNKKNALQYLIDQMRQNIDIHLYNDGMFYRDYIHVDSVCRMLYEGMRKLPPCRIYNVGSGRSILFRDLILLAHTVLESKSRILRMEPPKKHTRIQVKSFRMSVEKINSYGIVDKSSPYEELYKMVKDG
jgi:nucleoside-diphosphate-sugar epimerase